jgi:hypothetical protein
MEVDKLIQRKYELQVRLQRVMEQEIEDFKEETGVHIKSITAPIVDLRAGLPVFCEPGKFKLLQVIVELDL